MSLDCDASDRTLAHLGLLDDAAPLYRDAPEAREARASGDGAMLAFMREALPEASESRRTLVAGLITSTAKWNPLACMLIAKRLR